MPRVVLERAAQELLAFHGTGASVVEVSHRSPEYELVHARAMGLLRELMAVPESHEVLLLQGGTRLHFGLVPMNFLGEDESADYIITGHWSRQAYDEAGLVRSVRIAGDSVNVEGRHLRIPATDELELSADARYVHLCSNNTIAGTQWHRWPETADVPLVIDFTSDVLSRQIDWDNIGMAYAGSQKNLGPAGVVVVVVRRDMLKADVASLPRAMRYAAHAKRHSLLYTPSTFSVMTMQLVLEHAHELGGVPALQAANEHKAELLYRALEEHPEAYELSCEKESRSNMNVVFGLHRDGATRQFLAEAGRRGMTGLKGHRSRGGIRASLYNWLPTEHVEALVELLHDFATSGKTYPQSDRPSMARRHLLLKVEYQHEGRTHYEYVKNLSRGGLLLSAELPVHERILLRLSFLGFLAPLTVEAVVRWSDPQSDEGDAQSGLEFVDLNEEAIEWLSSLVGGSATRTPHKTRRVFLVERNTFLREVYTQEVLNWAEVHGDHVEFVSLEDDLALSAEPDTPNTRLAIVDLDGLEATGLEMLEQLRARFGASFPIIFLGGAAEMEALNELGDVSLFALSKPLNFGQLMDTVGLFFSLKVSTPAP